MRVIAGVARSMPLRTPEGTDTRPTTDRIKETLFNILQNDIPGAVFLDLFSGSGGIGIEALSRGARKAYFIENAPAAINCIQENLNFTKLCDKAVVLKQEAALGLSSVFEKEVDIIFMDPPYDSGQEERVLQVLSSIKYVTENTLIILEASLKTDMEYVKRMGFDILREKKYKTNKHCFLKKSDGETGGK